MAVPEPTKNNVAVITGASGGIGSALTKELARRGYNVLITARHKQALDELAEYVEKTYHVHVEVFPADLADPSERQRLIERIEQLNVAILCNNAGVATFGKIYKLNPETERSIAQLNAIAVHDLTLAVVPAMVAAKAGGILTVGSIGGNMPIPGNASYSATKAFVNSWSESIRGELKSQGVHVTLLAPGPVRTAGQQARSIIDHLIPGFMWVSTDKAAALSLDALEKNKMRVVPGLISKAMSVSGGYAPRPIVAPIVGFFYRGFAQDNEKEQAKHHN